jgi:chromosome segregation ATPase
MPTESIKTKRKDSFVRVSQEDGPLSKDGLHKLIVNEPLLRAQIKELTAKYIQSEAKVAQLSLQIENSKLGFQPKVEDQTFDYDIVQGFCEGAKWNPFEKPPYYMCTNPSVSHIIRLPADNKITTALCRLCKARRQTLLDATSETSMVMRALKITGRKNVPLVVALHNQLQTITQERDDYREFKDSHKEWADGILSQAGQNVRLLNNKIEEQRKVHGIKEREQRAEIEKSKSENNDLKTKIKMMDSRLSEMNNHVAEFETLRLENVKLKEAVGKQEELDYVKTYLKETEEQITQAQFRLSEITEREAIVQSVLKHPDWAMRFQTIDENDELRKKLEATEKTVASLKIQQESNNQTVNTIQAENNALSTVKETLENKLTFLEKERSFAHEVIIDLNKYFVNKQSWESRKHADMPDNYDELKEAIRLKTEMRQKAALFIQQIQGKKQP